MISKMISHAVLSRGYRQLHLAYQRGVQRIRHVDIANPAKALVTNARSAVCDKVLA
jgi:hypothetical protein